MRAQRVEGIERGLFNRTQQIADAGLRLDRFVELVDRQCCDAAPPGCGLKTMELPAATMLTMLPAMVGTE